MFGHAVGKVLLARIPTQVHERQHDYGLLTVRPAHRLGPSLLPCSLDARLVTYRGEQELVDGKVRHAERQQNDDQAVQQAVGAPHEFSAAIQVTLPLDALRRNFKHPRQDQRRDRPYSQCDDENENGLVAETESGKGNFGQLHQDPGHGQVGRSRPEHVAATQLCNKGEAQTVTPRTRGPIVSAGIAAMRLPLPGSCLPDIVQFFISGARSRNLVLDFTDGSILDCLPEVALKTPAKTVRVRPSKPRISARA